MCPITEGNFSMLDLLLVRAGDESDVVSIVSDRSGAIASHHFPVVAAVRVDVIKRQRHVKPPKRHWAALKVPSIRDKFLDVVVPLMSPGIEIPIDSQWESMREAIKTSAESCIPKEPKQGIKPWIGFRTLSLIEDRNAARCVGDWDHEKGLRREIKRSARKDKSTWLEELASSGDWKAIRKIRKPRAMQQTRLRHVDGDIVATHERANTFADHLETVQWHVRPATLIPNISPAVFPPLPVNEGLFQHAELRKAIFALASGKSVRDDDAPIEAFKAMALEAGPAFDAFLDLCNNCLVHQRVPKDWLLSRVALIFKKGDPANCNNYRPICLLPVAYKVFAAMLKQRLLESGHDDRLWYSQFGFRSKRSTEDAVYVARRQIELSCARRGGQISLLALDWSKAFDSVHVDALLDALRRLGIPLGIIGMIASIMRTREFFVEDCNATSSVRSQRSGISQGCTLSPLLFISVMTVLMHDAVADLGPEAKRAYDERDLTDLAFADDTLLMGVSADHLSEFLRAVAVAGQKYGLELHYGKLQLVQIGTAACVTNLEEPIVQPAASMNYLGTILSNDGRVDSELNRRIGMLKGDFLVLQKVWKHSSLTRRRKLEIFKALIESKLYYCLPCAVFTKASTRRLDGFQCRCLRKILGISPAFVSRVSNAEVLRESGQEPASSQLLRRQLLLLGRAARAPDANPLKSASFIPGTLEPATNRYVRRVGRPRLEWVPQVLREAYRIAGGVQQFSEQVQAPESWKHIVGKKR